MVIWYTRVPYPCTCSKLKPVIVREYVQKNEEDGLKDRAVLNMRWAMR